MIQVKSYIANMSTYSPPWSRLDRTPFLRLDLNENTLPPPQHVKEALKRFIEDDKIQMYPSHWSFLSLLAEYTGIDESHLIVTNGSDQAIEVALRAFLGPADEMVMAQPGFPMFTQIAGVIGARVTGVSYYPNIEFPHDEFLASINAETKLAVLINPDNPTGASVPLSVVEEVLGLRADLPVIVDEAYFEFTGQTALPFLQSHPNLIILRTFSKAFAMAGLRLGYIIAHPDIVAEFYKVRGPFDVNSCALVAAEAQILFPAEWKEYVRETMTVAKPFLEKFFHRHGVKYYPGAAHFMLVQPQDRDGAVNFLKENGILVRPMIAPSIDKTFRMNVGTLEQTEAFANVYESYLSRLGSRSGNGK